MNNYVVLEGVKGVGKSSIYQLLTEYLRKERIFFQEACPTKKSQDDHSFWELAYRFYQKGFIKEQVYTHRFNQVAENTNWDAPLILGDRSIITSYVSSFWKYGNPEIQIRKVDELIPTLRSPNLVLYFNASIDRIMSRISQRKDRTYGKEDETESKVIEDIMAYQTLRETPISNRIAASKWIDIDSNFGLKDVFDQVVYQLQSNLPE